MAIFLNENSKVIVQGMTGATGMKHTKLMLGDGTNIVGGVNPRKAGTSVAFDGTEVPVFGTVAEAMEKTGANVSVLFVPPAFAKARMLPLNTASRFRTFHLTILLARVSGQIWPGSRSPCRLVAPHWQMPWRIFWALKPTSCMSASFLSSRLGRALRVCI